MIIEQRPEASYSINPKLSVEAPPKHSGMKTKDPFYGLFVELIDIGYGIKNEHKKTLDLTGMDTRNALVAQTISAIHKSHQKDPGNHADEYPYVFFTEPGKANRYLIGNIHGRWDNGTSYTLQAIEIDDVFETIHEALFRCSMTRANHPDATILTSDSFREAAKPVKASPPVQL